MSLNDRNYGLGVGFNRSSSFFIFLLCIYCLCFHMMDDLDSSGPCEVILLTLADLCFLTTARNSDGFEIPVCNASQVLGTC